MQLDVAELRRLMAVRGLSQVELARTAGVSRARLNVLLKNESLRVQDRTSEKLARALGLNETALDAHGVEKRYLRAVAQACQHLDLTGLAVVDAVQPLAIDRAFAPPQLRKLNAACDGCLQHSRPAGRVQRAKQEYSLSDALNHRRILLLGDPGAGKTTTLRFIAHECATGKADTLALRDRRSIPVFVRVSDWAEQLREDPRARPLDAALSQLEVEQPLEVNQWLDLQARAGKVVWLFDGLDEATDPDLQPRVVDGLRRICADDPDAPLIVSSRTLEIGSALTETGFEVFEIESLCESAIVDFLQAWCHARHGCSGRPSCARCAAEVARVRGSVVEPRIRVLAGNPMLLTLLLVLHESGAALPRRRYELYGKLCDAYLASWERKKGILARPLTIRTPDVEDRELLLMLETLALRMQRDHRTLVSNWCLAQHCAAFLTEELGRTQAQAGQEADALIGALQERCGLLVKRGTAHYAFRHFAFQEYLAARAVCRSEDPAAELQPFVYHPRWCEVVRLAASELDRRTAERLVRTLLDDPDPAGRFICRALVLALRCLADGALIRDPQLLRDISMAVAGLGRSRWLGVTLHVLQSLQALRDTRHELFARETVDALLSSAGGHLAPHEARVLRDAACARDGAHAQGQDELQPDAPGDMATTGTMRAAAHDSERRCGLSAVQDVMAAEDVRESAVWALRDDIRENLDIRNAVGRVLTDVHAGERLRATCLRALTPHLPKIPGGLAAAAGLLSKGGGTLLGRTAAGALANLAASGHAPWAALPIERIEQVLISADPPCPCLLRALRGLVDAREIRRLGVAREARLRAALAGVLDRVQLMFVFGSAARSEQAADSDIDLMVIGDVGLEDLTPGLRVAEEQLGRQVNAVAYSSDAFLAKLRARNPFVRRVVKGAKLFVTGGPDELNALAGQSLDH